LSGLDKLKQTVRSKARRTSGDSLPLLCASLNVTLRGWFTYFRHCHWTVFRDLDGYIRGRLRATYPYQSGERFGYDGVSVTAKPICYRGSQ
jgi:hypothetical protein